MGLFGDLWVVVKAAGSVTDQMTGGLREREAEESQRLSPTVPR